MPISHRALCALLLPSTILLAHAAGAAESVLERTVRPGQVEIIDHEVGAGRPIARNAFAVSS
jgi:hypothetical protein